MDLAHLVRAVSGADAKAAALRGLVARATREPLTWFLAVGVVLFSVDAVRHGNAAADDATRIGVSTATVRELERRFEATTGRAPSAGELEPLVRRHVRDAVLAREARAMGIDHGDLVIERRLVQKMELLLDATVAVEPASDDDVRAYVTAHTTEFVVPARIAFEHAFFDASRRGDARADAAASLARRMSGAEFDAGDAFVLGREVPATASTTIEERFGGAIARAVEVAPIGVWAGPVEGRFGVHLVRVRSREPARAQTFDEARPEARRAIERERRREAVARAVDALVARYDVVVPSAAEAR